MHNSLMASCLNQTSLVHLKSTLLTFSVGGRRLQVQLVLLPRLFTSHSSYYESTVRDLRLYTCSLELDVSSRTHSRTRCRCKNSLFACALLKWALLVRISCSNGLGANYEVFKMAAKFKRMQRCRPKKD